MLTVYMIILPFAWACSCTLSHLEKKLCWPVDEVSPSYESLCLRLSGGSPWPSPPFGAEISMLLLLSLLLELRPRADSPSKPELSWEEGGESATCCSASSSHSSGYTRKLHIIRWELMRFSQVNSLKLCLCESIRCEWIWVSNGRRREWGSNRQKEGIMQRIVCYMETP